MTSLRIASPFLSLPLAACEGIQSALSPAGPIARQIAGLWWGMLTAAAAIFALVVVLLLYAVFRAPEHRSP
jgi:cytochrome c oxidase subunit 2